MKENVIGRWLDTTFGFRGRQNILSWAVAGGLAYYLWYLPEQRKAEQHQILYEQKRRHYEEQGLLDVDKRKPIPDKQQNGLIVGGAGAAAAPAAEAAAPAPEQQLAGAAAQPAVEVVAVAPAAPEPAVEVVVAVPAAVEESK